MPKSNVPIRICGSKTRTGCRTCKQRHVKCDEDRPICRRCQKSKRSCDYDLSQPQKCAISRMADLAVPVLYDSSDWSNSLSTDGILSPYGPHKLSELAAVKNFTTYLSRDFAGCFSDDVWCQVFPRVAQHELCIWHGIAAISMLENSMKFGRGTNPSDPDVVEAIKQYNKAIQRLNVQLALGENAYHKDVVLLCCVLFAIFECLQNHFQSALRHVSGGMKLLMEWENETPSEKYQPSNTYLDTDALRPILLCLDSQVVQMGAVDFRDFNTLPAIKKEQQTPISFATVQEAHVSLNSIFNRLSRWTEQIEPGTACDAKPEDHWLNVERRRLQTELLEWAWAFEAARTHFKSELASLLLSIQKTIMQIIFDKEVDGPSEMEWDKYLPRFEEAVISAETFMRLQSASALSSSSSSARTLSQRRTVLTITMDVVLSLYLISTRCRRSQLRRRALNMLKTCGRREGIWDSTLVSEIAEKIIDVEEKSALDDGYIPESARVWQLECCYGKSETATIRYLKLLPNGDGSYRIEKSG